jgi:hypothetical protein
MIVVLLFLVIVLVLVARFYQVEYQVERDARQALHRARELDNNQRSVDNELWAERVAQARKFGQDQIDVLEAIRQAGAPGEPGNEHIRNALGILMGARTMRQHSIGSGSLLLELLSDPVNAPLVFLTQPEYVAIKSRLWSAVNKLEGRAV